jgi:hypothetical protein
MADGPTLRQILESAEARYNTERPQRGELIRVAEARSNFRENFRKGLLARNRSLPPDAVDDQCRAGVMMFDDELIARLRDDVEAIAWRDAENGLELLPSGQFWRSAAGRCILRTEKGCTSTLCADRGYCERRLHHSGSFRLIPGGVKFPGADDAPVLIPINLGNSITESCFATFGLTAPLSKKKSSRLKPFWEKVERKILEWLEENGCPERNDGNQAILEQFAAALLQNRGWEAAEGTIRRHVKKCMHEHQRQLEAGQ